MKSCSILVVDDESELREIICQVLTTAGHRVTEAANGAEAITAFGAMDFDLVVTDVIMPEKDGMQVISELRKKKPGVRIVAMSGGGHVSREQYLKLARALGAHSVLEKPFNNQALLSAVEAASAIPKIGV
jgi:CheY-like chemotaxis protein